MNCFMSYNPNVAHEVKVTTWIKEFDGASPVYPSFPNEGDVFIVFDNDEATEPSVNKTYTSGDWADTSSGDAPTGTISITENGEGIDVSSYAYADVNVSGGSSDFSSCKVTIINTATGKYYTIVADQGYAIGSDALGTSVDSAMNDTPLIYDFMTYKGEFYGAVYSAEDLTVSGNASAEYNDDPDNPHYIVTITGNCTITAKGTEAWA